VLRYGERRVPRSRELTASALICARSPTILRKPCSDAIARSNSPNVAPWKRHWKPATVLSQNALIAPGSSTGCRRL